MLVVTSSSETPGMDRGHHIAEHDNKPLPFTKWAQHSRGNAVLTAHAPVGVRAAFAVWPELDGQFHSRAGQAGDSKSTGLKAQHAIKMQLETNFKYC